jgi:lipooligosaccharide transport system permease protein
VTKGSVLVASIAVPYRPQPAPSGTVRATALVERNVMIYRHTWPLLLGLVIEPVVYLIAFGLGLGQMIGPIAGLGRGVSYCAYVAPALLATTAMNGSMNETALTMFAKLRVNRIYDAILSTPVTVRDVAFGEVGWAALRGVLATVSFLCVITLFGLVHSFWALLVLPGSALVGFAFAAVGLATVTYLRDSEDFQLIQLVMLPMFLFATTFYPLGIYPRPVQILVECLPLYQGIQLLRLPALGVVGPQVAAAAVYLALLGVAAFLLGERRLTRSLRI